jgi:hypothetical protein
MASRIFHVTPSTSGFGWQVKIQNRRNGLGRFHRKSDAVEFARDTATDFVVGGKSRRSFVITHDRLGRFARTIPVSV